MWGGNSAAYTMREINLSTGRVFLNGQILMRIILRMMPVLMITEGLMLENISIILF